MKKRGENRLYSQKHNEKSIFLFLFPLFVFWPRIQVKMKRKRNVDPDAPVTSTKFRAAEHRIVSLRCGKGKNNHSNLR